MAQNTKEKKLKGISDNYTGRTKEQMKGSVELILRETFLRSAKELFDNFGIEKYSVEQLRGMVEMLEKYIQVDDEIHG